MWRVTQLLASGLAVMLAKQSRSAPTGGGVIAVKDVGVEVDALGPRHGAGDCVNDDVREHVIVVDDRQRSRQRAGEVELPYETVAEHDSKHSASEMLDLDHACSLHRVPSY